MRKILKKITSGILATALAIGMPMAGGIGIRSVQAADNSVFAVPVNFPGATWEEEDLDIAGTRLCIEIGEVQQFSNQYTYSYVLYIPKVAVAEPGSRVWFRSWMDCNQGENYLGSVDPKNNFQILNDNGEVFLAVVDEQEDRDVEESEYKNFLSMDESGDFYKITVKDAAMRGTINLEGQDNPTDIDTSQGGAIYINTRVTGIQNTLSSVVYLDDLSVKAAGVPVLETDFSAASMRGRYYEYVLGQERDDNHVERPLLVALNTNLLKLGKSSASVKVGKTVKIKATAVLDSKITYKSSNKKVATVTSKGVVKGKKAGKAKITVSANGVNKTFKVTVNK